MEKSLFLCEFFSKMIQLTPEMCSFLSEHASDDPARLLLSASRYPGIDVRWAVEQLEARRQLRYKLPEWVNPSAQLILGGRIPAEQCSSEQTAQYKQSLVIGETLCDLTGGMGVDCYYMSRGLKHALYVERQEALCEAARHNFRQLGAPHIEVMQADAQQITLPDVDTLYLDPARRAHDGSRVYDLAECEPNVVAWRDTLLSHCKRLIVKVSPMADVSSLIAQMPGLRELHIVAVRNECKEVLLVLDGYLAGQQEEHQSPLRVYCVDFRATDEVHFDYAWDDEPQAAVNYSPADDVTALSGWLYEPDVTLLKAGAFRLPCQRFGLYKLGANSHLYHSPELVREFPGRIFKIEDTMLNSSKLLKTLKARLPQANISTRNFPLAADALRRKTGVRDGGDQYLFGTTSDRLGALLLLCRKALLLFLLLLMPGWLSARRKAKETPQPTVETLLQGVQLEAPCMWNRGMTFVHLGQNLDPALRPQVPDLAYDTLNYDHTLWTFDGILGEEDWMGRQCMHLLFKSPQGRVYQFSTGRVMSQVNDTTYHPALNLLCALDPVKECDRRLRGKQFYLLINDERLLTADSLQLTKFVPVRIDSVTVGTEVSPLRIWITHPSGTGASVLTSLPDSRENMTSTPVQRYFSFADPYLKYPNITREVWSLISNNQVRIDMTLEEVRLSWGRPQRFEHYETKGGIIERWHYANRRVLEFVDGRVRRMAYER